MRTSTATIVAPRVEPEAITTLRPKQARKKLRQFALDNRFTDATFQAAFAKLGEAVQHPGQRIHVHYTGDRATEAMHDCLETIVANPAARQLAGIALDATPGTEFKTRRREDACQTWTELTNSPN